MLAVIQARTIVEICYVCPRCASTDVEMTLPSLTGAYCQCRSCGHLWHDDQKPAARTKPSELKRKSDRAG